MPISQDYYRAHLFLSSVKSINGSSMYAFYRKVAIENTIHYTLATHPTTLNTKTGQVVNKI
jgi:hypothetical protein